MTGSNRLKLALTARTVAALGLGTAGCQQLFPFAKPTWQKPARIIGDVIAEWVGPATEQYFQAGDGILAALVEVGVLEGAAI